MQSDPSDQLDLDLGTAFPFGVVVSSHIEGRGFAVVLRQGVGYAACVVRPAAGLVVAPNHEDGMEGFNLCAPLSEPGFAAVLDWTDRHAAMARYAQLIDAPTTPDTRIIRLLDHVHVESVR